jgi:hypothetical protein
MRPPARKHQYLRRARIRTAEAAPSGTKAALLTKADRRAVNGFEPALNPAFLAYCARRLRAASAAPPEPERVAATLALVCEKWRDPAYKRRRNLLEQVSLRSGFSIDLLDESLNALLEPFEPAAFKYLAKRASGRRELLGFIMPGNVVGAGLHEVVQALVAGAAVIVKSATAEPLFFDEFACTVAESDPVLANLIVVTAFERERADLTRALAVNCDALVAFGADSTMEALQALTPKLIPFGSRASGGFVEIENVAPACITALAAAVARDVALFEQRGCLSLHHVFVRTREPKSALRFAMRMARALKQVADRLPPPRQLSLGTAAPLRSAREEARWRKIGGEAVDFWEGSEFSYNVIFEPAASFRLSPGYRTVYVSMVSDQTELERRLCPFKGKLEAFAVFDPHGRWPRLASRLRAFGVSHVCAPGRMQSPPLDWPHDRGRLLKHLGYRV